MNVSFVFKYLSMLSAAVLLSACGASVEKDSAPEAGSVNASAPDAVPKAEAKSKCGNPKSYEVFGKRYHVLDSSKGFVEKGIASWYGKKFHGKQTSSCETYDMFAMSAAHKNLPLPTYVEVTNLDNGRKIVVRVNDRGPFHDNRVIDLSYAAATKLDMAKNGTALVQVRAIDPRSYKQGGAPKKRGAPVYSGERKRDNEGAFYIQVGAFSERGNAESLKHKLRPIGRNIRIADATVDGKRLYRVQIGPLNNIWVADSIVESLGRYGVWEHRITTN